MDGCVCDGDSTGDYLPCDDTGSDRYEDLWIDVYVMGTVPVTIRDTILEVTETKICEWMCMCEEQ